MHGFAQHEHPNTVSSTNACTNTEEGIAEDTWGDKCSGEDKSEEEGGHLCQGIDQD